MADREVTAYSFAALIGTESENSSKLAPIFVCQEAVAWKTTSSNSWLAPSFRMGRGERSLDKGQK